MFQTLRFGRRMATGSGVAVVALAVGVAVGVDLTPHVESDFFFAPDAPELEASRSLAERYPGGELLIVRAEAQDIGSAIYLERVTTLGEDLALLGEVYSVVNQDATSPLWGRVLMPDGGDATNLVVQLEDAVAVGEVEGEFGLGDSGSGRDTTGGVQGHSDSTGRPPLSLTVRLDSVLAAHQHDDFRLFASGVPVIVERIRQGLTRDLIVFSAAALLLFGISATVIYRNGWVVAGTILSCLGACAATLLVANALGIGVGLLTANIVTIVFVLTLSHTVFIISNWRRALTDDDSTRAEHPTALNPSTSQSQPPNDDSLTPVPIPPPPPAETAVPADPDQSMPPETAPQATNPNAVTVALSQTIRPSAWCMLTTLLGFLSLRMVSAEPLRELGGAGAIGTVIALGSAFLILPGWLVLANRGRTSSSSQATVSSAATGGSFPSTWISRLPLPGSRVLLTAGVVVVVVGAGVVRLETDPTLLSYFASSGEIRPGLEKIDRAGGSSPLLLAVSRTDGERMDNDASYRSMWQFQDSLEADPATGSVLSPAVLLAHAKTLPLANLLPISFLVGLMEGPAGGEIAQGYISEDRREVLYSVRMIEAERTGSRQAVMDRLTAHARSADLTVNTVGGLYDVQGRLGKLLASSLKVGLGGLLGLFILIAFSISRSLRTTLAMFACLLAIPSVVLGLFGHLRIALDIITSPAANVALAMGVDSIIHLVSRVRSLALANSATGDHWQRARTDLAQPITVACLIICLGFGIFVLSDFPPTRLFGTAVIIGTISAALAALVALPGLLAKSQPSAVAVPEAPHS